MDKKALMNNYKNWFASDKPVNWELKPLDIKVSGNVASVFYEEKFSGKRFSGHVFVRICRAKSFIEHFFFG